MIFTKNAKIPNIPREFDFDFMKFELARVVYLRKIPSKVFSTGTPLFLAKKLKILIFPGNPTLIL